MTVPSDFEAMYRRRADPWSYETSRYEAMKYRTTLAALPRRRYRRTLELGCSIGVLSAMLARRSTRLVGIDCAPTAIDRARQRNIPNAEFLLGQLPDDLPLRAFDLIVASEVLYYLEIPQICRLARLLRQRSPGADCVMVAYSGRTEAPLTGQSATRAFLRALGGGTIRVAPQRSCFDLVVTRIPQAALKSPAWRAAEGCRRPL